MKAPKSGHILNAPSCVVAMSWHLILDPGFSEQSLRYQLAKFPVCSSRVSLDVRNIWLDKKEGGERAVVTFDAQRMLGRLEESAMGNRSTRLRRRETAWNFKSQLISLIGLDGSKFFHANTAQFFVVIRVMYPDGPSE